VDIMSEGSSFTVQVPQPGEITGREKEDAMGAYLMMFAAWAFGLPLPVLNLIAAIIYFYVNKKVSRFVAFHSLQSLLSQIPVSILNVALLVWLIRILVTDLLFLPFFFIALIFVVLVNILYIAFSLVALVRARRGQYYYMPFFGRVAFARYYGPRAASLERKLPPNRPPEGF
jgi:uncharacterized Tic20 family protein